MGRASRDHLWQQYWAAKKQGKETLANEILDSLRSAPKPSNIAQPRPRKRGCSRCGKRL